MAIARVFMDGIGHVVINTKEQEREKFAGEVYNRLHEIGEYEITQTTDISFFITHGFNADISVVEVADIIVSEA